ncbi:hypothetical protein TNCV_2202721 [Trichonephila clavipes]|nr:hypothetical protein TNCV_2202721 [Trichonephila clavipes]
MRVIQPHLANLFQLRQLSLTFPFHPVYLTCSLRSVKNPARGNDGHRTDSASGNLRDRVFQTFERSILMKHPQRRGLNQCLNKGTLTPSGYKKIDPNFISYIIGYCTQVVDYLSVYEFGRTRIQCRKKPQHEMKRHAKELKLLWRRCNIDYTCQRNSSVNPTPLAHADTQKDNRPRGDYHNFLPLSKLPRHTNGTTCIGLSAWKVLKNNWNRTHYLTTPDIYVPIANDHNNHRKTSQPISAVPRFNVNFMHPAATRKPPSYKRFSLETADTPSTEECHSVVNPTN